ncbi:zinc-dependent metalloprotease family protein [Archaeoglobus neptunius]|uniref:zinc-dependent metalloprotease family protein n=1 Tax=Archaeoglobus neptunius TaxID=2798580 RepID=UPI00192928E8|nr:zinc-dependent metalloprotease family protein [Archaeoglobus neptunius]
MTASEFSDIVERARKEYMKRYGVDPLNPKVVVIDGIPVPKEYAKRLGEELVRGGRIPKFDLSIKLNQESSVKTTSDTGPQLKNNALYLWIVEAAGGDAPSSIDYLYATLDGYRRFQQFNDAATLDYYFVVNNWDASDVYTKKLSDYLQDLKEDMDWVRYTLNDGDPQNDMVIGWIKTADDNYCGYAYINGYFSVGVAESGYYSCWVLPLDIIAQHEISHNFNADDMGRYCWEHDRCIMNYCWAIMGTNTWCDSCWQKIYNNINGISET